MKTSRTRFWIRSSAIAALGASALFGTAQAADFGAAPPVETWTGFSFGVGGGIGFLNADLTSSAARTDTIGQCTSVGFPAGSPVPLECIPTTKTPLFDIKQSSTFDINDLGDTGGFFTVQGAYDYQFAPRWVAGAFVDADWSDISAHAKQTSASSVTNLCPACGGGGGPVGTLPTSNTTIDALVSTDWNISVGGRLGYLATPGTLLYVLGAYTHADLDDARVKVNIGDPNTLAGALLDGGSSSPFSNSPTSLLVKLPDSLDGFSLGGGAEAKLGGPWALKLEYRWTHLDGGSGDASSGASQTIPFVSQLPVACLSQLPSGNSFCPLHWRDIKGNASADLDDIDLQTVRAVLTYHFWSGGGYGG